VPSRFIQRFGHNKHGPKKWGSPPPFWEGSGSSSNTESPGPEAYLHTKWHLYPCSHLSTTDMNRKLRVVPLWGRGAGSPSNTMCPGPRPTCVPSFILIHPIIWPQCTNVTDRQDRQRSDSIGRTVLLLQTVTQERLRVIPMVNSPSNRLIYYGNLLHLLMRMTDDNDNRPTPVFFVKSTVFGPTAPCTDECEMWRGLYTVELSAPKFTFMLHRCSVSPPRPVKRKALKSTSEESKYTGVCPAGNPTDNK